MYVTFNQKIYVYWEVQLERMESTNLLKVLEAQPEFRELLGELGVGEPWDWGCCWESWVWVSPGPMAAGTQWHRFQQTHQPPSRPQIPMSCLPPAPCFTKPSTIQTSLHSVPLRAPRTPPSWTGFLAEQGAF